VALVLSLGFFYVHQWSFASSDDQCTWRLSLEQRKVLIEEILPFGVAEDAGLLEGDELVAINGRPVQATPARLGEAQTLINALPADRVVIYTVRRNGRELYLPIRLIKPLNSTHLIVLFSALVAWSIGLLVAISSPRKKVARHFYYLGLVALLGTARGNFPAGWMAALQVLASLVRGAVPALWVHFFLRFPYPFPLRKNRRFLVGLYGTFLFLGLLNLAILLAKRWDPTFLEMGNLSTLNAPIVGSVLSLASAAAVAVGLGLFWTGSRQVPERHRKALLPALVLSTAILLDLLIYAYLSFRVQDRSLMFQREAWVFFAPLPLLPISFAYAIFRHGLFDVRRAILRWLSYFLVAGGVLAAYLGALAWLFSRKHGLSPEALGVLAGLAALPVGWLLRTTLLGLRRKFRRDLRSSRDLILGRLRKSRTRLSEAAILESLVEGLRTAFRPQLLLLLPIHDGMVQLPEVLPAGDKRSEPRNSLVPDHLKFPAGLLQNALDNNELIISLETEEADWLQAQGPGMRKRIEDLGAQVLVLLMAGEEPRAALFLGGKYAELGYGREDRQLLSEAAQAAGLLLETALAHQKLLDQGRIEIEMRTARHIQEKLVSVADPGAPGFQCALRLDPALETCGDLLRVGRVSEDRWMAIVGDVSGKGLPAALYMSQATALLRFATRQEGLTLEQLLPALDNTMRSLLGPRDFITLGVVEWNTRGQFRLARAGHPPALLLRGSGLQDIETLFPRGRGLGLRPVSEGDWVIQEGTLEAGHWLVMYSDGLTEAMNQQGELYGVNRLGEQLQHFWGTRSVRAACEAVFTDVASFETQNRDDRTLFILGREGA